MKLPLIKGEMKEKMYLEFLLLCAILSQVTSHNSTKDSLNIHERMKRVIDRTSTGSSRPELNDIGYVVDILANGIHECAGSILTPNVILTVATCVLNFVRYTVRASTVSRTGGSIHLVNGILTHPNYVLDSFENNIALISIVQPIILAPGLNRRIPIYDLNRGHLPPNTTVTVSGWGVAIKHRGNIGLFNIMGGRVEYPDELRSISLPTISLTQCRNHHHFEAQINLDKLICTHHPNKSCGLGDDGNPLVFEGNLVGVLSLIGHNGPDVFLNVAFPEYRNWILTHMDHIPNYPEVHQQTPNRPTSSSSPKVHPGHH